MRRRAGAASAQPAAAVPRRSAGPTLRSRIVLVTMVWLGLGLLLYPQTAGWFSQVNQAQVGDDYSDEVDAFTAQERRTAIDAARAYNESLRGGAAYDPFTLGVAERSTAPYREYLEQLEGVPSGVMARIRIPAIGVKLPVFHGTTEDSLLHGVGHLFGTDLPVGGVGTRSVLTAHSGLADAVLFTHLNRLAPGDLVFIDVYGETLAYEMIGSDTVLPHETQGLVVDDDRDLITLITCTPVALNTHRLLVHAERVELPDTADAQEAPEVPGFPWWLVIFGGAAAGGAVYIGRGVRARSAASV